jgi:hypothetical protein
MEPEEKTDAAQHIAVGAGVGAAGAAQTIVIAGLAAAPVLPVFIVVGAVGGLAWWGVKKLME